MANELYEFLNPRYRMNANIPDAYINLELNDKNKSITKNISYGLSDVLEGKKLYLYSERVGTGKTTIATYYLQKFIDTEYISTKGWDNNCPGVFVNFREYTFLRKASINNKSLLEEVLDTEAKIRSAKLLVLDEAAVYNMSDYDLELFYVIVNNRDANKLATIFTGNMTPDQMVVNMGGSIARRVLQGAKAVEVTND